MLPCQKLAACACGLNAFQSSDDHKLRQMASRSDGTPGCRYRRHPAEERRAHCKMQVWDAWDDLLIFHKHTMSTRFTAISPQRL